ncbi:MAG: TolC family protein [Ignavibacteria bacterium]|nr:TolC family protein [Ignavibacteria bacterium]
MIIKYLLLHILFLIYFFTSIYSQTIEITLNDAIRNAYNEDPNIKKLIYQLELNESNIKTGYGNLFPDLKLSSGWTRTNQAIDAGTININGVNVPVSARNETTNNFSLSLRSDVTLFNGFVNYDRIELNRKQKTLTLIQLEKYRQDITLKIISSYITVLKNIQIVKINEATYEDSRVQLDKIKKFVEVGKKTLSDVYRQDVIVAQNELAVEQAKNNLEKSLADLAFDAKLSLSRNYTVNNDEFNTETDLQALINYVDLNSDVSKLVENALKNRYDYKSSLKNLDILSDNLEIAKSNIIFPTISGFGAYTLSGDKIGNLTNQRVFTIGISLNYPIFQGFSLDNQRQLAEINLKSAEEDLKNLKNQIELDIKKAVLDMKSLLKQIEIVDRNLKNAEQDLLLAEESYRVGLGTLLEINTAAINLNNIRINKSNLIYNFILAQKQLEYYQGLLKIN